MISGILVKSFINSSFDSCWRIVLILGIGTLFKGGDTSKKYSNKLMQLRVTFTVYCYYCFSWLLLTFLKISYIFLSN